MSSPPTAARSSAYRLTLPDWSELVTAFRGDSPGGLILQWAHALARLHRDRRVSPELAERIDRRRSALVEAITNWVTYFEPDILSAQRVGAAVDALAEGYIAAEFSLATAQDISDLTVHNAWHTASALAVEWSDLAADVVYGQRPIPWPPVHLTQQKPAIERNSKCSTLQPHPSP